MKVTELKNQLNTMEKNELIALIVKLYKNDKMCRNMLDAEFGGEEVQAVLLANAKKQLYDIFFSKASLSLRNAKAVLSGFKKTAVKRFIDVAVFIGICCSQLNIIKFKVKIILFIFSRLFKSRQDCFGIS